MTTDTAALFDTLDKNNRGYLYLEDLRQVSNDLSDDELMYIFEQMDTDKDGQITKDEFIKSFQFVLVEGERSQGYQGLQRRASAFPIPDDKLLKPSATKKPKRSSVSPLPFTEEVSYISDPDADKLEHIPCSDHVDEHYQEEVLALYEQLQAAGVPTLLNQFESVIGNFCKEIKEQKEQNERLQKVYEREKDFHSKHLSEVELELDKHVQQAEERAAEKERERLQREKNEMRKQLESEISELQDNIRRMQKMEDLLHQKGQKSDKIEQIKHKMEEMGSENMTLRHTLTENQLEMAVIKAELSQMRQEYDEKCIEMMNEKERLLAYVHETDAATRQLQLLYDANKRLHDTNDNLRSALESRSNICRQYNLKSLLEARIRKQQSSRTPSPSVASSSRQLTPRGTVVARNGSRSPSRPTRITVDTDDDIDSGFARNSDSNSISGPGRIAEIDSEGMSSEHSTDLDHYMNSTSASEHEATSRHKISRDTGVTGPPERTFRVILAGDASVGKSSIMMRLIKNTFVDNLPSTLGVDFHVKLMNVDGQNVAIQLWDTAGQERFRSLSKSYFRRADGALLIYDCTCEQSFLNVRNWMDTIQESTPRPIPICVIANKIDLRVAATAGGKTCVNAEQGRTLAKTYGALFHETSAKQGSYIEELAMEIVRELLAHEDSEISSSSLVLRSMSQQGRVTPGRCAGGQRKCT